MTMLDSQKRWAADLEMETGTELWEWGGRIEKRYVWVDDKGREREDKLE